MNDSHGSSEYKRLLMDERAGRAVALEHGLQVAGTAAIYGATQSL